jgi:hypothetical protein
MAKSTKAKWEVEFSKQFRPKKDNVEFGWSSQDMGGFEMVKDFISKLLKQYEKK